MLCCVGWDGCGTVRGVMLEHLVIFLRLYDTRLQTVRVLQLDFSLTRPIQCFDGVDLRITFSIYNYCVKYFSFFFLFTPHNCKVSHTQHKHGMFCLWEYTSLEMTALSYSVKIIKKLIFVLVCSFRGKDLGDLVYHQERIWYIYGDRWCLHENNTVEMDDVCVF